ncbi:MAG: tetratricopeptide repeat protein [Planctomycetota bacterium]
MGAGADRGPALSAQVGPYALVGALGRGGTATVFRARGPRGEECALKLLERRDDAGRQRFLREAQVLAELSHPALVPLRGAGEHQGVLYLAMPFLGGGTLSQRVAARGPLASRDAAELLQSLADGVAYAHDHGVLHRDVKPDNVLFERDGAARLGDFGLARRTDPGATRLSRTGAIQGTPGFWAPEQASGGATGPWTDVYGLGATLYFALTGLAPHAGESLVELLRAVEQLEVEPPSRHVPDVDPALEAVCLRCLAKRPEQRFASARELERALGRVVRGEAPRPGARRWPWVLALVGCLGVAALAVARWPRDEPPVLETSEPDLGSARVELEGGDPVAALAALDALPDPRHPRALRLRVDALLRLGDQDAALATSDELLAATPNDPVARVQRARIELDRGARDAAAAELARARELSGGAETEAFAALRRRIEALPEDPRRALDALYAETRRDPRSVEAWLRLLDGLEHDVPRLLEALDQALGHLPDAPALIRRRARARAALGRAEAALEDFKRLEIMGQLRVDDLARLSVVHQLLQDWPQATRWAERAVATDPRHPEGWTELGMTYFSRGDLPVARAALTHAFALDPRDPRARASLAQVCHGCEDFAHSVALFELTLAGDAPEEFARSSRCTCSTGGAWPSSGGWRRPKPR